MLVDLSFWAGLQTQMLQLQCLLSCPSEPVFQPNCYNTELVVLSVWASLPTQLFQWLLSELVLQSNCYNYSACCPVHLSQSSNTTFRTTELVVLSVWASFPTQLLQLHWLLSCSIEPVFKPNCYNYRACWPVRLSQSSNPTVAITVIAVLSVWASLQTQLLQIQCLLSCPSEPVFQPNCFNYRACCPVRLS